MDGDTPRTGRCGSMKKLARGGKRKSKGQRPTTRQNVIAVEAALAPEVGLEPTTTRLTVACSTIELLRNRLLRDAETTGRGFYGKHFLQNYRARV